MNKQLKKLIKEYNIIMIMKFGSHLYGTNTPESDEDFKGIYLPSKEQILLQNCPKSINITPKKDEPGIKNDADDTDIEIYSLQYFIHLCLKGETVGIDMLHCNEENIVYKNTALYDFIQSERSKFYSKDLSALVSYCRKQASKYGLKGSRISDARKVLKYLKDSVLKYGETRTMEFIWKGLPKGEHIKFVTAGKDVPEEFYQVCGKKIQKTSKLPYVINQLETFIQKYGARALLAEKNEGIDFKAVSHAMRYGLQLEELFLSKDIKFPLASRRYLLRVKQGVLNYKNEVAPNLDAVIERVEKLSENSSFPQKTNRSGWDKFVKEVYENIVKS